VPVNVTVLGKDELVAKYKAAGNRLARALLTSMQRDMVRTADYARTNKLSGDPLHRRTGNLSRAVTGRARLDGTTVVGEVGTAGIPYAYVHEMGGTFWIRPHIRRTGFDAKDQRIRLLTKQGAVRAAVKAVGDSIVRGHNATYPQRAFLKPSLEENRARITDDLRAACLAVLNAT
jgi:phage gpG-like protein